MTPTEWYAILDANADYFAADDPVKAAAYSTAVRYLLHHPHDVTHGAERARFEPAQLLALLREVDAYLAAKRAVTTGTRVVYASLQGMVR